MKQKLGERVRQLRQDRRMSQVELAAKMIVSSSYISDVERGVRGCNVATIRKLADALGVDVGELMVRETS